MNIIIFLLITFMSLAAQAEPAAPDPSASPSPSPTPSAATTAAAESSKFDAGLLGGSNPVLTEQERAGVNITRAWKDKSYETLVSQPGANSSVEFRFGESLPTIVCAILQVTDVELQAGEVVTHINLGDSTRWTVESALSGSGSEQVEHLIVKPRDIGLSTSLVVTTDRRTYHLLLVSDETEFMHDVTFLYREALSPTTPPSVASATPAPSPVAADPPARRHGDGKQVRLVAAAARSDGAPICLCRSVRSRRQPSATHWPRASRWASSRRLHSRSRPRTPSSRMAA